MPIFKYTLALFALSLFLIFNSNVSAQSVLGGFDPNANATVRAFAVQPDGKILIGGDFTTLAPNGGATVSQHRIARFNPDGTLDASFDPHPNSSVLAIALQPDGRIVIGGFFATVAPNGGAAVTRNNIARLNADGTLDMSFDPNCNGGVMSLAVKPDGKILVGGQLNGFSPNGGATVARNNVALLNANGTVDTGFNPNANSLIASIVVQPDGKTIIGGDFSTVAPNGGATVSRNRLARFNTDNTLDISFNPNPDNTVNSIVLQPDGKIILAGFFTSLAPNGGASVSRNRIARVNSSGTLDTGFDPNADNVVYSMLLQPDGKILVGGLFATLAPNGGATIVRYRIARLNADGTVDAAFDPNVFNFFANPNPVRAIAVQSDGKILIGGAFNWLAPNGGAIVTRNFVARLERDGTLDQSLDLSAIGGYVITTAVQPDGKIIIAGNFSQILGQPRNRLARLNADGTLDTAFNPIVDNVVYGIAVQPDGKILLGGVFTNVGGQTRNFIARLNSDGSLDTAFNPGANNAVYGIALQPDGKILVGGEFSGANSIGGQSRNRIARLNSDGTADSFNPNANSAVYAIALQPDGKILVGGFFSGANSVGTQTRNRIARLNADGSVDTAFNPNANAAVYSFALQSNGMILVGGDFSGANAIGGTSRGNIARLNPDGTVDAAFSPNVPGSTVFSIAVQSDGKVLIGGQFISTGGLGRNGIARLNPNGSVDSWNPNADGTVYSVAVQPDGKVLLGGTFANVGGQSRNLFARLSNDTAALSTLNVTRTTVTLTRDGSAPQFTRVVFEQSVDNGANWTPLGNATPSLALPAAAAIGNNRKGETNFAALAPQTSGYTLTGLSLLTGQNILVRARGYFRSGYQNGSETTEDKAQSAFLLAPTAASVSISGKVLTPDGSSGLRNAQVILTDSRGNTRTALTTSFGYFSFDSVQAGETYVVSIISKRFQFAPQIVTVKEELTGLSFTALE